MSLGKLLERIIQLIPVLLGVSLIVFVMMALTPGDPVLGQWHASDVLPPTPYQYDRIVVTARLQRTIMHRFVQ